MKYVEHVITLLSYVWFDNGEIDEKLKCPYYIKCYDASYDNVNNQHGNNLYMKPHVMCFFLIHIPTQIQCNYYFPCYTF